MTAEQSDTNPSVRPPTGTGSSPAPAASNPVISGVQIEVAAIDLDVVVRPGRVSASGRVVPPAGRATWVQGFDRVAPGAVGTAVVAGHVSAHGKRDVFADLSSVRTGHEIVVRSGSVVRTYAVTRVSVVDKAELTRDPQVWGENGSHRRLVLITCDDDLGYRKDGHRVANYVVVAEAT
ncbi:class F sortase [Rothia sp. ARF10]|nr:class F sortase [Rothia sp. ARF10]